MACENMMRRTLLLTLALTAGSCFAAIDANTATEAELDSVKGLGPSSTARILKARDKSRFKDWDDFMQRVKGIKPAAAAKLSQNGLTVNDSPYPAAKSP
jgi:competence protein ComEA